jgi:hypothetical protein
MLVKLSRHPDNPVDAPGQTLAAAHSLAAAGGAGGESPVFDLVCDDDEDVKPEVKTEDSGAGSCSRGGRYGGRRPGGGRGRNGGY